METFDGRRVGALDSFGHYHGQNSLLSDTFSGFSGRRFRVANEEVCVCILLIFIQLTISISSRKYWLTHWSCRHIKISCMDSLWYKRYNKQFHNILFLIVGVLHSFIRRKWQYLVVGLHHWSIGGTFNKSQFHVWMLFLVFLNFLCVKCSHISYPVLAENRIDSLQTALQNLYVFQKKNIRRGHFEFVVTICTGSTFLLSRTKLDNNLSKRGEIPIQFIYARHGKIEETGLAFRTEEVSALHLLQQVKIKITPALTANLIIWIGTTFHELFVYMEFIIRHRHGVIATVAMEVTLLPWWCSIYSGLLEYIHVHLDFFSSLISRYQILRPPDGSWGSRLDNGTWTGMVGMVVYQVGNVK